MASSTVVYEIFESGLFKRGGNTWGLTIPLGVRDRLGLELDDVIELECSPDGEICTFRRTGRKRNKDSRAKRVVR